MIKLLFGMKLEEVKRILGSFDELQKEVKTLQEEKQQLEVKTQELEGEVVSLSKQLEKANIQIKTQKKEIEKQNKKTEVLDDKIQSSDKWIKDTREKVWDNNKKISDVDKVLRERSQKTNEHQRTTDEWLKKTREQMWDISKRVNEAQKWKEENRKLEYKIKRYMPESKYELALADWYYENTGKDIDFKNPKTFNEMVQWSKLNENIPEKSILADKYAVREWVAEKLGNEYLIPLIGVYERVEDIDFSKLPNKFVIKCNHGSGYNILIKDKSIMNEEEVKEKLKIWLHENFTYKHLELHYASIKPRIIIEQYMTNNEGKDLLDYKFYCFGGKVFCSYERVETARGENVDRRLHFFDRNHEPISGTYEEDDTVNEQYEKPENYDQMIKCAEILSAGFSQVRVDLYNINGSIYFGEMTFTSGSGKGFVGYDRINDILGEQWRIQLGLN